MQCQDVMTKNVRTVPPSATIRDCAALMRDADIGFLPVADTNGRMIGACTDRDIVIRALADGKPHHTPISDVMTRDIVAVRPTDDIQSAERMLANAKISRVPVCDENMRCLGVISLADLVRAEKNRDVGRVVEEVKSDDDGGQHAH